MPGYQLLLKHVLQTALHTASGQEIVYRNLVRHDYPTLASRIARLADGLAGLGHRAGDTIGVLDWDSHRYLESYFAIPGSGAVLHTVNVRLSPEQILYTINHARDVALLVHVDFLPIVEQIWDRIDGVRTIILMSDEGTAAPQSAVPITAMYEALLASANPSFVFPDLDENTTATTFYTTGTTGQPKGVSFTHRQLVLHTMACATALATSAVQGGLNRGDVYMPMTPMFHVHAWGLPFVATMLGLKQVYPGRYDPSTLIGLQQGEGVTLSHCVPTILQMLLASPAAEGCTFSGWKMIIGGSALPQGLAYAALDRGIDIFAGYGMSESGPVLTIARPDSPYMEQTSTMEVDSRTCAGIPIPLVHLEIVDQAMNPLPRGSGKAGEIVVQAPWLTEKYTGDEAASAALRNGPWLRTGDVGMIEEDGSLRITDRLKDIIKTGGEWVSSLEIEDLLLTHPDLSEAAIIGVPDSKWGERPMAILVARQGRELTPDAVRAYLQKFYDDGRLSKWAIPANCIFTDALLKTSVGKIDKKALRARYVE
ncbi:long-chain-fatty-acid--CoA ligase [Nostoc sp. CHAB 5844]|nr:long-chain-fatty-acid--CoA ligase [Nostoc sp. CHAB 5844]